MNFRVNVLCLTATLRRTRCLSFLLSGTLLIALIGMNEAHAAPTFQAFSGIAAAQNGNADPTLTLPAHAENDILLLATVVRSGTATVATPSGWTQIGSPTVRAGTATYQFFWIRAGATTVSNPLIDRTGTTGDVYAAVVVYRNAISIGDPWEVKGTVTTGTTDPSVITGITTLTNDSLVVVAVSGEDNNNGSITTTGTNPAAYTEHYVESGVGNDGVITFSEAARTTAGATGNVSVNWNAAVPVGFGGIVLALKPQGTVLGDGTDPANAALAPDGAATMADAFTFKTGTGTDTITDVTVGLGSGAAGGLSLVEITNDAGTTVYGSVANPATDTPTITLSTNTLTATTTQTQYKIRVTPKSHAAMPAPPGSTYSVTAKINSWSGSGTQEGSDTAGTTVTIDNLSPGDVTGASGSVGSGQVILSWANPADADLSSVVVLRDTVAVADTPVEGATYVVGNTIGTSVVRCVIAPPTATCTDTGLTNGTAYHYKIYAKDSNGNYAPGVVPSGSPFTPGPNCYAVASAAWNVATTWANASGGVPGTCAGSGGVPDTSITAYIGETATAYNVTIPAGYAAQAANLTIGSNTNNAKSLTLSAATASLTVGGYLTINKPASNTTTNALNVNAGTVTIGGSVTLAGTTGTASRVARINVTTGTLTIGGDLIFVAGVDANNVLDLSGGAATVNLAGAFTATVGTLLEGTSSTFNYNGTAAQTVRLNVGNIDYYNLHINNTSASGATLNADITTANVFGNVRVQSGTLNDGGNIITGGAGDTFEVANGATFVYTEQTWVSGFSTRTFGATSTVEYARNGGQDVASENYGNLTLRGSGTKVLPGGTLNIAGNLSMSGTAALDHNNGTVNMNGSAAQSITLNSTNSNLNNLTIANTAATVSASSNITMDGNFTNNASATFSAGSFLHYLAGNFANNGSFVAGTSTFTFNSGGSDQTVTGATTFNNLTLDNTNGTGTELTLNNDTTVNGTFSFLTGYVITGANTLIIGNTASCGVTGAGTGIGYVVGNLRKNFTASLLDCTFEVGDSTRYAPVQVVFDSVTTPGTVTASTTSGDHPNIATSNINSAQSVNRYWTLTQGGGLAFGGYTATFNYNAAELDGGVTVDDFVVQRYSAGAWLNTTLSSTTSPTTTQTVIEGETGFGDFAIGESSITGFLQEREFIFQREVYY